jgi:hypothetical protein
MFSLIEIASPRPFGRALLPGKGGVSEAGIHQVYEYHVRGRPASMFRFYLPCVLISLTATQDDTVAYKGVTYEKKWISDPVSVFIRQ